MVHVTYGWMLVVACGLLAAAAPAAAQEPTATPTQACLDSCRPADANPDAPSRGAEPVTTILYVHCFDATSDCPVNTQELTSDDPTLRTGWPTPTFATDAPGPCGQPDFCFYTNWRFFFSSAGFVEFGKDGKPSTHQEPGLAEHLRIEGDTVWLIFYLATNPVPMQSDASSPGNLVTVDATPAVGVYARVELGRTPFSGSLVAEYAAPEDVADFKGAGHRLQLVTQDPAQAQVYEVKVPLRVVGAELPSVYEVEKLLDNGYVVSLNLYQVKHKDATAKEGWQVLQNGWEWVSGPDFPPRLLVTHGQPLVTKHKSLVYFDGDLHIRWRMMSPWGSYDVDIRGVSVGVTGPTPVTGEFLRQVLLRAELGHNGHFRPINGSWKLEATRAGLSDGEYVITLKARNLQGTYELVDEERFLVQAGEIRGVQVIGSGRHRRAAVVQSMGSEDSPGLEVAALVASALGVALRLSRRRP